MKTELHKLNIGIVGGGVVGQATAKSLIEHVSEIRIYDTLKERSTHSLTSTLTDSDLVFICLPSPAKENGQCDTSTITQFFRTCAENKLTKTCFVLRSTVPIGYTQGIMQDYEFHHLVHSPEFLTARCANIDAQLPSRNIIGCPESWFRNECVSLLHTLYSQRFPSIPIFKMTSSESEAVKLMQNSFFAVKVGFWNEMRCLADKLRLDWDIVIQTILSDGRINPSHTQVPGPDGKRGFGGACLPKDLHNLIHCFLESGVIPNICMASANRNLVDRDKPSLKIFKENS